MFLFVGYSQAQKEYSQSTIRELNNIRNNLQKAIVNKDSLTIARWYYKLALKYDYLDTNDSCDLYYGKALNVAERIRNDKAVAVISNAQATTFSDRGLHQKALNIYKRTTEKFLALKDTSAAAGTMLNAGSEYFDVGEYKKGLNYSIDALKLKLLCGDSTNLSAYYHQIGSIFNAVGNKEKWKEYLLQANELANKDERYGDFYRRMDILNELGAYYFSLGNYNFAKKYYDTLYVESSKRDYLVGITAALSNLVPILIKQKKYSEALLRSKKALALSERTEKIYRIIHNSIETAKIEIYLKKFGDAEKHLKRAEELALKYNFPAEQILIYKYLSELYSKKGYYKTSLKYLNRYIVLKDSIQGEKTKQKIAELEAKYQTERKDAQINLLNKDNLLKQKRIETQRQTTIILILFFLFVLVIIILFYFQTKLKAQNRILEVNQKLLRTQMNPHFIFNALLAIQNYVLKNKKFEASDYISQFALVMRTILENSRKDFITLDKEIELLKNYVSLQQLRFENSFIFKFEMDNKINPENIKIPPMLVQPFIENAIEHGLRKSDIDEKILSVKYLLVENNLKIVIEDNGLGIEKANKNIKEKKHRSYAMEITKERLTNITKLFKIKIDISIQDLSLFENMNGTRVELIIPLK